MPIKLVALKRLRYPRGGTDGKEYAVGDTFEATSERDAAALRLIRAAKDADEGAGATVENRGLWAEDLRDELQPDTGAETPKGPGRRYNRRDMRAKED